MLKIASLHLKLIFPILGALFALAACSEGTHGNQSDASHSSGSAAALQSDTQSSEPKLDPCNAITAADVAEIITTAVTRAPDSSSSVCVYRAQSGANVTIDVAQGDAANGLWTLATTYNATKTPLAGVGQTALYNPNGTTLIARKGERACRIDVVGWDNANAMDSITKDRGPQLAAKLSKLCKKVL
jgi:hypothetical protein